MDKLKIIKAMVLMLTFCMVFVLCLLVGKVFEKNSYKPFEIKISNAKDTKIDKFKINGNYAYIKTSDQIHVVDIESGTYKGMIFVTEDK